MRQFTITSIQRTAIISADSLKSAVSIFEKKNPNDNIFSVIENILDVVKLLYEIFTAKNEKEKDSEEIKKT